MMPLAETGTLIQAMSWGSPPPTNRSLSPGHHTLLQARMSNRYLIARK